VNPQQGSLWVLSKRVSLGTLKRGASRSQGFLPSQGMMYEGQRSQGGRPLSAEGHADVGEQISYLLDLVSLISQLHLSRANCIAWANFNFLIVTWVWVQLWAARRLPIPSPPRAWVIRYFRSGPQCCTL